VFDGVQNPTRGLEKLRDDLRALEKRVAKLEGGEELLIERARSSAAVAASGR
jgi:cell division protein FtsB